jgi:hypothetical protein
MTMSADYPSGGLRGFLAAPVLRIAIPAWGRAGAQGATTPQRPPLSREEVSSLFEGDLRPGARSPATLTESERQRNAAVRIRRALHG